MPGSFFVLLRFFLRVDDVIARIIDSRFFHEFGKNYMIHEQSVREATFEELTKVRQRFSLSHKCPFSHLSSCALHSFPASPHLTRPRPATRTGSTASCPSRKPPCTKSQSHNNHFKMGP